MSADDDSRDGDSQPVQARPSRCEAEAAAEDVRQIPAYVRQRRSCSIRLERADAEEAAVLLDEAWRATAPKRVVAPFDADS